jgi:hypothetical protein
MRKTFGIRGTMQLRMDFKQYHNNASTHSHLPLNLVGLPLVRRVNKPRGFSGSSNISCQPAFAKS